MPRSLGFIAGAKTLGRALSVLRSHSELWRWCWLPLALNVLAFVLAAWMFLAYLDVLSGFVREAIALADPARWYEWLWVGPLRLLGWLVKWIMLIVFGLAVYVLFTLVGGLLASPFLDVLSERIEGLVTGSGEAGPGGFQAVLRSAGRALREEAKRMGFFLGVQLLFLALALLPGLQPLVVVANLVFAALFVSLDYTGYVLDRRGIRFRQRRSWIWQHRRAMFGFGTTALGTFLIPGLNFLCLPWLVTAGTLLALEAGPPERAIAAGP